MPLQEYSVTLQSALESPPSLWQNCGTASSHFHYLFYRVPIHLYLASEDVSSAGPCGGETESRKARS